VDVEGSFQIEAVASSALAVLGFDGGVVVCWKVSVSDGVVRVGGGDTLSWTIFGGVGGTDFSVAAFFGWELVGGGALKGEEGVYHFGGCGGEEV